MKGYATWGPAVLLPLALATAVQAQSADDDGVQRTRLEEPLVFGELGVEVGNNAALCVQQGPLGLMWFGTQDGLVRYDGTGIRRFVADPNDPDALPSSWITDLAVDRAGHLWIATGDGGISRYDENTDSFESYQSEENNPESLASNGIVALVPAAEGGIWIAHGVGALDFLKDGAIEHAIASETFEVGINTIAPDAEGRLWIASDAGGAIRFNPRNSVIEQFLHTPNDPTQLPSDTVLSVLVDPSGDVWIGTDAGLSLFDEDKETFTTYRHDPSDPTSLSSNTVTSVFRDTSGTLWVGTETGLNKFYPKSKTFSVHERDVKDRLRNEPWPITDIFEDRSGVLWTTRFVVPNILNLSPQRRSFELWRFASGPVVAEAPDGTWWVGSGGQGLFHVDRDKRELTRYSRFRATQSDELLELRGKRISAVHAEGDGTLWLGVEDLGLVSVTPGTGAHTIYPSGQGSSGAIPGQRINQILGGGDSFLWLATTGAGLLHFDKKAGTASRVQAEGNGTGARSQVNSASPSRDGKSLWVATASGVVRVDVSSRKITAEYGGPAVGGPLGADNVNHILEDSKGRVWIATSGGGVDRLDPQSGTVENLSMLAASGTDTVQALLEDSDGRVWLSTAEAGLLLASTSGELLARFTEEDGLSANQHTRAGALATSDGELVFTSAAGISAFRPGSVPLPQEPPKVFPVRYTLANHEVGLPRPIWTLPTLELSHQQTTVSFEIGTPAAASELVYLYKIAGLHSDWLQATDNLIEIANIPPGEHRLKVRAATLAGQLGPETAIDIHVDPPLWLTWWAYLIYVLVVVTAIVFYWRYQRQRIRALQSANQLAEVDREIELTAAVQRGFLPKEGYHDDDSLTLAGFYQAAERCSGDWWWYEREGDIYRVFVGDVTGHGTGPAMVTAAVGTAFRVQGRYSDTLERLHRVNAEVNAVAKGQYHMVLTAVEINAETGQFRAYSAGGMPVLTMPKGQRLKAFPVPGTPLGTPSFSPGVREGQLTQGERLLLLTDGIPEVQMDESGRQFGLRRVQRTVEGLGNVPIKAAVTALAERAKKINGDRKQSDDWTFVMLEWHPRSVGRQSVAT